MAVMRSFLAALCAATLASVLATPVPGGTVRADGLMTIAEAFGAGGIDDMALYHPEWHTEAAPGDPDTAQGHFLDKEARSDGAVCLDGTPSAYYFRNGTGTGATKWYIHQQGGGWCESLESCYSRSKGSLGSSKSYPATASLGGGYFSTDPAVNPMMYNWNAVYMRYCDGNSFSGSNATATRFGDATLHWRGKHVLTAQINSLLRDRGLSEATDVVVSGCSAGGLATFLHCDHWAERIRENSAGARVVCMPDSGFFLDTENGPKYHSGMTWAFHQQNSTSGVNDACIEANTPTNTQSMCMFAEHTAPHIRTPTFPLQAEYDSWQIANDLGSSDTATINAWGANLTALVKTNLLNQPQHGIFLDSCKHHCGEWGNIVIGGMNQAQALKAWYTKGSPALPNKGFFRQGEAYPCASCCKPN